MPDSIELGELVDPDSPTTPVGPFPAILDGEHPVIVTAVLERTAVWHPARDNSDRHTATFNRLLVDPDHVRMVERRDDRRDSSRRGRDKAAQVPKAPKKTSSYLHDATATTHGGKDMEPAHKQRIDELRQETVRLREEVEASAALAELGRDLVRLVSDPDTPAEELTRLRQRAAELAAGAA